MRHIAIVLIGALSILTIVEGATPPDPHQLLLSMPRETRIDVRMVNGDKLAGRLGEVGTETFSLTVGKARNSKAREVAYSDVHSVKRAGMRTSTKVLLVTAGVMVVALAIFAVIGAAQASLLRSL